MARYLLAYHGGGMPESEEEGARVMAAWTQWFEKLGKAVVDAGNPIGTTRMIASDRRVTEGGGANPVTGYSIIEADNLDMAVGLASGCPILDSGGSVEVGETFTVM